MSLNKRIKGNYTIETVGVTDGIVLRAEGGITIDGDLIVSGTQTSVESTNTVITDNTIVLNAGETGSSITEGTAGIDIDRGTGLSVGIQFNELAGYWEATDDGTVWYPLNSVIAGGFDLVDDLSPQLGADLDMNGYAITTTLGGDIVLAPDTTGSIVFEQDLTIKEQLTDETPLAGYNKLYAKAPGKGGSGLYVSNDTTQDEVITKRKAIIYSIIF